MGWFRGLCRGSGAVGLWAVVLAPSAALVTAAVLDRGPGGAVRLTLFPAALAALDPYVWDCARNSLAFAAAVTFASRLVGVALARVAVRWRFWGRSPLVALACAGVVVPPAFGAMGLSWLFGTPGIGLGPWAGWAAWFWVGLTSGAPLVGLSAASALARVDPGWEDAARLAGANRARVWRQLVWPVVRPEVARALAVVFGLTLLEPGAPLVLGLRRTLGFQITESALDGGPGQITRAAVLALGGVILVGLGRVLVGWWGGARAPAPWQAEAPVLRASPAGPGRGAAFALALAAAAVAVWLPVLGLASEALSPGPGGAWRLPVSFAAFAAVVRDPLTRQYLTNSALLGLSVVALDLLLARALAAWSVARRGPRPGPVGRMADWPEAFPPLAIGVGALAIPWTLRMAADALGSPGSRPPLAEAVADAFDPDRTPWVALVFAVGLARLPLLTRSAAQWRRGLRPALLDAAVGLGATRRQARRVLPNRWLGASPTAALLTLALAATGVTPALLLAPTAETRPAGPAVLALVDEPGGGLTRAAALATAATAVNLAALALAARDRSGLLREWSRT
jgi:ABC-type Fe3+ transport system permease subunit